MAITRWTEEQDVEFRRLLATGACQPAIVKKMGFSRGTLTRKAKELGIDSKAGGKPTTTPEQCDVFVKLWQSGMSMNKIAKLHETTGPTVRAALERVGAMQADAVIRPTYDESVRVEALRLYCAERLSAQTVARKLGIRDFTVKEWATTAGVIRSMSEAATLAISSGKKRGRSTHHYLWHSPKTGEWVMADSTFEAARMGQLDTDESVTYWSLCNESVSYTGIDGKTRRYIPDLFVRYADGSEVVEEIKPEGLKGTPVNLRKFAAAIKQFEAQGIAFKVVTENQIGMEAIEDFRRTGISAVTRAEALARQKVMSRAATAKRHATESPEQRADRLGDLAQRRRLARVSGEDVRVRERAIQAKSEAKRLAAETPEQCAARKAIRSQKAKQRRANETPEQRAIRITKCVERNRFVRANKAQIAADKDVSSPQ